MIIEKSYRFIAVLLLAFTANQAQAALVDLQIRIDDQGPGSFSIFADVSLDANQGLVAYSLPLGGDVLEVENLAPAATLLDTNEIPPQIVNFAFSLFRSSSNQFVLQGSQDVFSPQPAFAFFGFGQTSGDLSTVDISPMVLVDEIVQPEFGSPILLARGTWDEANNGTQPSVDVNDDFFAISLFNPNATQQDPIAGGLIVVTGDDVAPDVLNIITTVPGDANFDEQVDSVDLNTLALNWQQTTTLGWAAGDFNLDEFVDSADLNALALNWQVGVTAPSLDSFDAALVQAFAAVPEPGTLTALLGLMFPLLRRRQRQIYSNF